MILQRDLLVVLSKEYLKNYPTQKVPSEPEHKANLVARPVPLGRIRECPASLLSLLVGRVLALQLGG
jgi:hypothetical protein